MGNSIQKSFSSKEEWNNWQSRSQIVERRHVKIEMEAALLAGALAGGLNPDFIVLSNDAGQFNVPMLKHALCCIHEERHLNNLISGAKWEKAKAKAKAKAIETVINDF